MFNFLKGSNLDAGIEEYKETEGAILLDVRSRSEYSSGHVPDSINIDVQSINDAVTAIPDKQTPIFVYCLSGSRSKMAASALKSMGYTQVKSIGGLNSYTGPIVKGK